MFESEGVRVREVGEQVEMEFRGKGEEGGGLLLGRGFGWGRH